MMVGEKDVCVFGVCTKVKLRVFGSVQSMVAGRR
jgi:hypothetical protein